MRITWCPPNAKDADASDLIALEYNFRTAMTRLLLIKAKDKPNLNIDRILNSYEFSFDVNAKKFSLSVEDPSTLKKTALNVLKDPLLKPYLKPL
ncbi:MAG: hypothetical protein WBG71_09080 [Leeuwenhoekiella sp.]